MKFVVAIIQLLRPHQWLKNLMLFFPPFLGGALLTQGVVIKGAIPFVVFSLVVTHCLKQLAHPSG